MNIKLGIKYTNNSSCDCWLWYDKERGER